MSGAWPQTFYTWCKAPSCTILHSRVDGTNSCATTAWLTSTAQWRAGSQFWNIIKSYYPAICYAGDKICCTSHWPLHPSSVFPSSLADLSLPCCHHWFLCDAIFDLCLSVCTRFPIFQLRSTTFHLSQVTWFRLLSEHENYGAVQGKQALNIFSKLCSFFPWFKGESSHASVSAAAALNRVFTQTTGLWVPICYFLSYSEASQHQRHWGAATGNITWIFRNTDVRKCHDTTKEQLVVQSFGQWIRIFWRDAFQVERSLSFPLSSPPPSYQQPKSSVIRSC